MTTTSRHPGRSRARRAATMAACAAVALLGVGACTTQTVALPPANGNFDYQIGMAYPPPAGVTVVSRDHEESPAAGLYNICYVNGFQAQTEAESWWLANHPDLVLRDSAGRPVKDSDWNELILDTSTPAKRDGLVAVVGQWIVGCRAKGFNAVEVDNLDSYSRSGGRLTESHAIAYMKLLADQAHGVGLAVAQKNSSDIAGRRSAMGTDFAVAEECNRWDECDAYTAAYGNRVFVIEYRRADFTKGCQQWPQLSIVFRDVPLQTRTKVGDFC